MNLFFKRLFSILFLMLVSLPAAALQVRSFYKSACERDIGVVLNANSREIHLLDLNGIIKVIPRYEIIYMASYSLDSVPIRSIKKQKDLPNIYRIETWQNDSYQNLLSGWPIGFSKDRVAFLGIRGNEIIVQRTSLWKLENINIEEAAHFSGSSEVSYKFAHPQIFSMCKQVKSKRGEVLVYSEQLLGDPISIKHELDTLQAGYESLDRYTKDQQFYPRPEIYVNKTSLGLWTNLSSRHGSSENRSNNFTPVLVDEFSSGPFGFQRRIVTGAAPIMDTFHEEPQTQLTYEFKADYFHMSLTMDPSTVLVGSSYNWDISDMSGIDIRSVEKSSFRFGFDHQNFALDILGRAEAHIGARGAGLAAEDSFAANKFGLTYTLPISKISLFFGSGSGTDDVFDIDWFRLNYSFQKNARGRYEFSYIERSIKYDGQRDGGASGSQPEFAVSEESKTIAAYYYFKFRKQYELGGYLSAELADFDLSFPSSDSKSIERPKLGLLASLFF